MHLKLGLFILVALLGAASAQLSRSYGTPVTLDNNANFKLYYKAVSSQNNGVYDQIQFGVSATAAMAGYLSLGFSSSGTMTNMDAVMCYMSGGVGYIGDYFFTSNVVQTIMLDPIQNYILVNASLAAGAFYCEFDRNFSNAGDTSQDFDIPALSMNTVVIWAYSPTVPTSLTSWSQHSVFNKKSVNLCPACPLPPQAPPVAPPPVNPPTVPPPVNPPVAPAPIQPGSAGMPTVDGIISDGEYSGSATMGKFKLYWAVDVATSRITFGMSAPGKGYVSIGLGTTMSNADCQIGSYVSSTNTYNMKDYWMTGHSTPALDTARSGSNNIISWAGNWNSTQNQLTFEYVRPLIASDGVDNQILLDQLIDITWAYYASATTGLPDHGSNRGTTQIFISSANLASPPQAAAVPTGGAGAGTTGGSSTTTTGSSSNTAGNNSPASEVSIQVGVIVGVSLGVAALVGVILLLRFKFPDAHSASNDVEMS